MASLAERLGEVADELTAVETKWSFEGVSETAIARVAHWRDVIHEAAYALNTGPHKVIGNPQDPLLIGVLAMERKLADLRWELTPREYQEYVATGALYRSVMQSVIDSLLDGGYEVVKRA